jgi:hypothetical protein
LAVQESRERGFGGCVCAFAFLFKPLRHIAAAVRFVFDNMGDSADQESAGIRKTESPLASHVILTWRHVAGDGNCEDVLDRLRAFIERSWVCHFSSGRNASMAELQCGNIIEVTTDEGDFESLAWIRTGGMNRVESRGRKLGGGG